MTFVLACILLTDILGLSSDGAPGPASTAPVLPDTATEIRGTATWCAPTPKYCHGWGGNAHVGAVESFRWGDTPYRVRVCHAGACTTVRVVSYCDCGGTLIDLSPAAFRDLAPQSRGRITVTMTRVGAARLPYLPPTDTR